MTHHIAAQQLRSDLAEGRRYQIIDVRSGQEYADAHIPCALNIPLEHLESRLQDMSERDSLVLVCQSGARASLACESLGRLRGDVLILEGGTDAWSNAGLPVVGRASKRLPLMRQVQLVVGPVVVLGSTLALMVDPRWAVLSLLMGAGLTLAGSTGWCGMAKLLAKMPWNTDKCSPASLQLPS